MTKKLFTLLLAVAASVGTMFAEKVQIGDLYYNLDATNQTAEVTSQNSSYPYWSTTITTANIPSLVTYNSVSYSVTSIGEYAFYYCSGLTSIEIPNSVTSIGDGAFYGCSSLTSVTIPNSVTSIGSSAFSGCTGLTSVTIPNSVTSIENYAFQSCSNLASIEFPNGIATIEDGICQNCNNLSLVTFPNSITIIKNRAFENCTSLTSIEIPNDVTSIGEQAFNGCTSLSTVTCLATTPPELSPAVFEKSNISFSILYVPCASITAYASADGWKEFSNIQAINPDDCGPCLLASGTCGAQGDNLTWELSCDGVLTISGTGEMANYSNVPSVPWYSYHSSIQYVVIGNNVTSIGWWAFRDCTSLTSVTIPNSVTSIGREAFYGCTSLTSVEAPAAFFDIPEGNWPYYTKILNHVIVNGGELTENALLFINRSYKTLQTLDVSGVSNTEFADEAFNGYYNLTELVLPENLSAISYMMVAGCINLQSINIPASVVEIDQRAFEDCRSIKTVNFGETPALTKIGAWAFYNCHELENIDIPEGVTEIGNAAFYGCAYSQSAHLPASLLSIGDNGFALCSRMTKMEVDAILPPAVVNKTFFEVSEEMPVYVPDESVLAYKSHAVWGRLNIIGRSELPTGIENVQGDKVQCTKILRDGQVLILRGENVYTLTGQKVK